LSTWLVTTIHSYAKKFVFKWRILNTIYTFQLFSNLYFDLIIYSFEGIIGYWTSPNLIYCWLTYIDYNIVLYICASIGVSSRYRTSIARLILWNLTIGIIWQKIHFDLNIFISQNELWKIAPKPLWSPFLGCQNFLSKIFIFDQNFDIWPNFLCLTKISIFDQNLYFLTKISIFAQNFYFWPKFKFLTKNINLTENPYWF